MAIEIQFDFVIEILVILFFYHKYIYHSFVIAINVIFFFHHKLIYHKAGIEKHQVSACVRVSPRINSWFPFIPSNSTKI